MGGWDDYITKLTMKKEIEMAAIFGWESKAVTKYASSPGFDLSNDEVMTLCQDEHYMREHGTKVAGQKCILLRAESDPSTSFTSIQLKSFRDNEGKTFNVSAYKTSKVLVIAKGTPDAPGGQVSKWTMETAEYLGKCGF